MKFNRMKSFMLPGVAAMAAVASAQSLPGVMAGAAQAAEIARAAQAAQSMATAQMALQNYAGGMPAAGFVVGAPQQTLVTSPQAAPPKQPGTIRIGVMMPHFDTGSPAGYAAGEPIRGLEAQLLAGPKLEVVKLTAMLPVQAAAEAKALDCDYVLTSSISQKVKSGGFGFKNLGALSSMTGMIPMAGGVAAMTTATMAHTAISLASEATAGVKAKADVTFEYALNSVAG